MRVCWRPAPSVSHAGTALRPWPDQRPGRRRGQCVAGQPAAFSIQARDRHGHAVRVCDAGFIIEVAAGEERVQGARRPSSQTQISCSCCEPQRSSPGTSSCDGQMRSFCCSWHEQTGCACPAAPKAPSTLERPWLHHFLAQCAAVLQPVLRGGRARRRRDEQGRRALCRDLHHHKGRACRCCSLPGRHARRAHVCRRLRGGPRVAAALHRGRRGRGGRRRAAGHARVLAG